MVTSNQATTGESANGLTRADLEHRLREVRHRFSNSLQFLNSLVGLHARVASPTPGTRGVRGTARAPGGPVVGV